MLFTIEYKGPKFAIHSNKVVDLRLPNNAQNLEIILNSILNSNTNTNYRTAKTANSIIFVIGQDA